MKRTLFLISVAWALQGLGQDLNITLTFQAKDSLTQAPVSLDSVTVHNFTENCDTTLYDSVSVLTMEASWPAGTGEPGSQGPGGLTVQQNLPNPFHGTTRVRIFLHDEAEVNLAVYDNLGKKCLEHIRGYPGGWHMFEVSSKEAGLYFFTVTARDETKTIRIVSAGGSDEANRISYLGPVNQGTNLLKASSSKSGFVFYLGNQLNYTAFVSGHSPVAIPDNPVSSETYTFEMPPLPFVCGSSQVTYEGMTYNTVLIGTQCWFRENLNLGTRIDGTQNQTDNGIIEKYCYNNNESNCDVYGGLYQWNEMMQYVTQEGSQGICPSGWHLPAHSEWTALTSFLGGLDVAGGKLKETGTFHWASPNTGATNESGFTALPGGVREDQFYSLTITGVFWTSSEDGSTEAWNRNLFNSSANIILYLDYKIGGYSVRCLKD